MEAIKDGRKKEKRSDPLKINAINIESMQTGSRWKRSCDIENAFVLGRLQIKQMVLFLVITGNNNSNTFTLVPLVNFLTWERVFPRFLSGFSVLLIVHVEKFNYIPVSVCFNGFQIKLFSRFFDEKYRSWWNFERIIRKILIMDSREL